MSTFFERLEARCTSLDTILCVGLDPHSADLESYGVSAEGAYRFCHALIEATHSKAAAFKPNSAFFEALGASGLEALKRVCAEIREKGALCLLDNKRGDISTTAEAYAAASYDALGADAVTVNGYMGQDSVDPFTKEDKRGVFVLCKTSNPTSREIQGLAVGGGRKVYEALAAAATTTWNSKGNVGLVVGATDIEALRRVRSIAPRVWILSPGVGFQGGDLDAALSAGLRVDGLGLLLPVSRAISRAVDPSSAAEELRISINAVRSRMKNSSAAAPFTTDLPPHSRDFLSAAIAADVLRFGSFTLKSGRQSPYFFNAGNFNSGGAVASLGRAYATAIAGCGVTFDVLFGPAYKGIPLATVAASSLADNFPGYENVGLCYNRKEAKGHGEGGTLVGASIVGKRVLIVDDVISAGTAIGESVEVIKAAGGIPVGVVIGLDRQERGGGGGGGCGCGEQGGSRPECCGTSHCYLRHTCYRSGHAHCTD